VWPNVRYYLVIFLVGDLNKHPPLKIGDVRVRITFLFAFKETDKETKI
jgi:hypothetical protein